MPFKIWDFENMKENQKTEIAGAALQAATILVAMASEKIFGDQNSGESHQLAINGLK